MIQDIREGLVDLPEDPQMILMIIEDQGVVVLGGAETVLVGIIMGQVGVVEVLLEIHLEEMVQEVETIVHLGMISQWNIMLPAI